MTATNIIDTLMPFVYRQYVNPTCEEQSRSQIAFTLREAAAKNVFSLAKGSDASIFNCFLSALGIVVSRYSGERDIAFHAPFLKGSDPASDVRNNVLLSFTVPETDTIRHFLNTTQESIGNCYLEQQTKISSIHQTPERSEGNIFISYSAIHSLIDNNNFDLTVGLTRTEDNLAVIINYRDKYFSESFSKRIQGHLESVLSYYNHLNLLLQEVDILTEAEYEQLNNFNGEKKSYSTHQPIIELFEEIVRRNPEAQAVIAEDGAFTYDALNHEANKLAHYLRNQCDVSTGSVVGIMTERSARLIVGMLAILKAGAAYLPIDPSCPKERVRHMLEETNAAVVLTDSSNLFDLDFFNGALFALDIQMASLASSGHYASNRLSSENLAYIIYTSGSSGTPKGVMISNKSLANLCYWHIQEFGISSASRATLYANIAFDASVWELWPYLLAGACVYPVLEERKRDLSYLVDFLTGNTISHCFLPTPICAELHHQKIALREELTVFTGGEELRIAAPFGFNIVNNYGPTESTVVATSLALTKNSHTPLLPIGKPISNTQIAIVDAGMNMVPVGVDGELLIAGDGLAKGYIRQDELTEEKFIERPAENGRDTRWYRTGDRGCWLEDGNILFKGRIDNQVKIRGHRIELAEVEKMLAAYEQLDNAVVLTKGEKGAKYLCAYYTAQQEIPSATIQNHLTKSLPSYMIPSRFIFLEKMPLTPNGKTDTKALLAIHEEFAPDNLPATGEEKEMLRIWEEVLQTRLALKSFFFSHGGDSIKAIRLIYYINEAFGADLKLMDIYKYDTPEKLLARLVEIKGLQNDSQLIEEVERFMAGVRSAYLETNVQNSSEVVDVYPVSDIQLGMLYHGLYGGAGVVYHDQIVHQVRYVNFEEQRFRYALESMTTRHEILRTAFNLRNEDFPVQIVYETIQIDFVHINLSDRSKNEQEEFIQQFIIRDRQSPFDIEKPGLWCVRTFDIGNDTIVLLLVCHHAILDGWSDASFSTELNNIYGELKSNPAFVTEKLNSSYRDYVLDELVAKRKPSIREFWQKEFFAFDKTKFPFTLGDEGSLSKAHILNFSPELREELSQFSSKNNTNPRMVCFSVYVQVIKALALQEEVVVGLHTHNRPLRKDSDKVLGCFLNSLPVKCTFNESVTWREHLKAVSEKVVELTDFSNLSLMEIAKLHPSKSSAEENPFFDTFFAYLDFHVYNKLKFDAGDFESSIGKNELDLSGQGVNNTFFNFIVNATLDAFNLIIVYKSSQLDEALIEHIACSFQDGLINLMRRPDEMIQHDARMDPEQSPAVQNNLTSIEFNF